MNVRSCQLCGKPLSRLRVGGDGDFCSKEHRNQYRLRRGMDRLVEVNKVTSLMRRRENPRQISAAHLLCNSALNRRGFFTTLPTLSAPPDNTLAPRLPGPASPQIGRGIERAFPPSAVRINALTSPRRDVPAALRITALDQAPRLLRRQRPLPSQIPQASILALSGHSSTVRALPRDFGMRHPVPGRVLLGELPAALRAPSCRSALTLSDQLNLRPVPPAAVKGNALRVSVALGFTVPAARLRQFPRTAAEPVSLVWPDAVHQSLPAARNAAMPPRQARIAILDRDLQLPSLPHRARTARFVFPGALPPRPGRPAAGALPDSRPVAIAWRPTDPRCGAISLVPPPTGFAHTNGVHLFALSVAPTGTNSLPHVAVRAFVPQEPVGCPTIAFEGTVISSITAPPPGAAGPEPPPQAQPEASASSPAVRLEEHFGDGWEQWMGGMADWLVDVAGVRTGSLALMRPTMELIDYEFEFLARIDTRSITWVARAAGLDEYQRCTLTALPGNELEFTRAAMIHGREEPAVTSSVRVPGKPRSAMTVRMQVSGDTFTVTMDGTTVDQWTDDRLSIGGIGFQGAPQDRARLYWVRLSSIQSIGKEYQTR